jgi:hypothetical protein
MSAQINAALYKLRSEADNHNRTLWASPSSQSAPSHPTVLRRQATQQAANEASHVESIILVSGINVRSVFNDHQDRLVHRDGLFQAQQRFGWF